MVACQVLNYFFLSNCVISSLGRKVNDYHWQLAAFKVSATQWTEFTFVIQHPF